MKKIIALILGICTTLSLGACSAAPASPAYQGNALIEEPIQSISLDWSSAPVEIVYGDVEGICITETAPAELEDDQKMQWYIDDTTLYIRQYTGQQPLKFGATGKKLKITIPTAVRLDALDITASSASIDTEVDVNTLHISTSSGNVELDVDSLRTLQIHTSSGSIDVTTNTFEHAELDASSGSISLSLPEESDFSADISTASGTFTSELPLKNIEEYYVCGNGEHVLTLSTSSGDISLKKIE